jgi:hypothetical protein
VEASDFGKVGEGRRVEVFDNNEKIFPRKKNPKSKPFTRQKRDVRSTTLHTPYSSSLDTGFIALPCLSSWLSMLVR